MVRLCLWCWVEAQFLYLWFGCPGDGLAIGTLENVLVTRKGLRTFTVVVVLGPSSLSLHTYQSILPLPVVVLFLYYPYHSV